MNKYFLWVVDLVLTNRLDVKDAILIERTKWCCKTTTAVQHDKNILDMQDYKTFKKNILLAETDTSILLSTNTLRLIDKWQFVPKIWDAIHFEIYKLKNLSNLFQSANWLVKFKECN
ncbi:hypothetical protein [[Mycoplasma] testudinis]|uniref:hypothetical protein n=1 Tax=[Mycoplasma] testudinis TaxID=33924 RepID=UPI00048A0C31|nr:hypothetical protein [[Mycoplasma] testudinis]